MYAGIVEFKPQGKMLLSANVVPVFTTIDGGVQRSAIGIDLPLKFCEQPNAENGNERKDNATYKTETYFAKIRPGHLLLPMDVDDIFDVSGRKSIVRWEGNPQ